MTKPIFLDDERFPSDQSPLDWVIIRTCADAKAHMLQAGCPSMISFDHDLADMDKAETGYALAKWICEQDMDHPGFMPEDFEFRVHSMNNVGAENISAYLRNYLLYRRGL